MAQILRQLRVGSGILFLLAVAAGGWAFATGGAAPDRMILTIAISLASLSALVHVASYVADWRARRRLAIIMDFLENDSAPGFCTSADGAILSQNSAARERFGPQKGVTMTRAMEPLFANPDAVVHRLILAAQDASTGAREDVVTRRGHVRVAVHRMPAGYLWRLEDLVDRPKRTADGLGLPILTFGPSGTVLYMNEVLRGTVGQRPKRLSDLFEDLPLANGGLTRLMTRDGPQLVRVVLSEPVNGRQEVFILPTDDRADDQIALDTLPVALLRLDAGGSVTFANRLARDLLPGIATGPERRLAALVEGLGRSVREWVSEAAAGRGLYRAEVVRVSGVEVETYLQITLGRPMGDGEGGLLAVVNDATELKTLEAQFVQSQKMQAIGQLAGGVAHDFNNLLTAISGHCDLLMLRHGEGDEDHADLTQITQNANRAAALVGQLLAFSRKQTLEMKPIDLRDTLSDLAHLLNRLVGERVTLRLEHDPALIPIRGDRRQLEQVLMNLVVNARDAMKSGGDILIKTECRFLEHSLTRDRVSVPGGQYVVISVSDAGEGISPDNLGRIFEPFFSTKRPGEGTGLGLSMAYGIVKQSGGYIFADSVLGEGTQFSLFFPALAKDAMAQIEAPVANKDATENSEPLRSSVNRLAAPAMADRGPVEGGPDAQKSSTSEKADFDDTCAARPPFLPPAPPASISASGGGPREIDRLKDSQFSERRVPGEDEAGLAAEHEDGSDAGTSALLERLLAAEPPEHRTNTDAAELDDARPDAAETCAISDDASVSPLETEAPDKNRSGGVGADGVPEMSGGRVVLLVEDEAPVRAFASRALRLRGYDVREAESAEAALEQLKDEGLNVDLFVTDVIMPGLDGPTWVREAMKARPNVRTIFISGYTQDAMSETSVPVPNSVFLPKPFSLADLTRTVERALA